METTLHDLDVARHLVRLGVPLFLARLDGDGNPSPPSGWQHTQPGDLTPVDTWRPGLALCAVMGHTFDVLDVDPRHGGTESARELRSQLGAAMPAIHARVSTPSGGWHYWLAPLAIGKHTGFMPGLDLQGGRPDGQGRGFTFVPPTVRSSKADGAPRAYQWLQAPHTAPRDDNSGALLAKVIMEAVTPAPAGRAPRAVRTATGTVTRPYVRAALVAELEAVANAAEGARNVQLNRSAFAVGRFVAEGLIDGDAATAALLGAACHAGLDCRESAATIRSAFKARGAL